MANPMYLTKDEKKMFEKVPEALRKGWTVEEEKMVFEDSPTKVSIRMRNMTIKDPVLLALKEKASSTKAPEEVAKILGTVDLSKISQDDLAELYFAMGPVPLTTIIGNSFKGLTTVEAVAGLASVATIRHGLLLSLIVPPVR